MNDLGKNHTNLVCQEAQTPQTSITIMGIKGILLYWLNSFLSNDYEETRTDFTELSHNSRTFPHSQAAKDLSGVIHWSSIPLQKNQIETSVLYISAFPQLIAANKRASSTDTKKAETEKIANQLTQFKTRSSEQNFKTEDPVIRFLSTLWDEFEISSDRDGWIAFRLSENGIQKWVHHLLGNDLVLRAHHTLVIHQILAKYSTATQTSMFGTNMFGTNHELSGASSGTSTVSAQTFTEFAAQTSTETALINQLLWQIQYTHARCCSLIYRERVHRRHAHGAPAARLLHRLIDTSDAMFWIPYRYPSKQYLMLLKVAGQLCQAFEDFQKGTILESASRQSPSGSSDCLSSQHYHQHDHWADDFELVIATRNVLKTLLQSIFQVAAPDAL